MSLAAGRGPGPAPASTPARVGATALVCALALGCADARSPASAGPPRTASDAGLGEDGGPLGDGSAPDVGSSGEDAGTAPIRELGPIRGASRCADAPRLEAPARFEIDPAAGGRLLRLAVPPGRALAVARLAALPPADGPTAVDGLHPAVCADCAAVRSEAAPDTCATDAVPPSRPFGGGHLPIGRALVVNAGETTLEPIFAAPPDGGRFELLDLPLGPRPGPDACVEGRFAVPEGVAFAGLPDCASVLELGPAERAVVFGVPSGATATFANLGPTPRSVPIEAEAAFAWRREGLAPGARCADAPLLEAGRPARLRVDLEDFGSGSQCALGITARGGGYLRLALPPGRTAALTARAALIADGGGYPVLAVSDDCDPTRACASVHEPESWTTPLVVRLTNPGDAPIERRLTVQQGGVGYDGNVIELRLDWE